MRKLLKSWKRNRSREDRRSGPSKPRYRPWLEPLEERIEPAPVWHNFPVPVPSGISGPGGVSDFTTGPDGAVWYIANWEIQTGTSYVIDSFVGRMATDGTITQFPVQSAPFGSILNSIITGPDGNLWFVGNNTLYRMTPEGQVSAFQAPIQLTGGGRGRYMAC
jgi:streptogramin lyase